MSDGEEPEGGGEPDLPGKDFQHYFSERPRAAHRPRQFRFLFRGRVLTFTSDSGVFGADGLDPGTALLIENLDLEGGERVLDLGCGWGPVGIAAALSSPRGSVLMVDVNRRAVLLSRKNIAANGVVNAEVVQGSLYEPTGGERFDVIVSNPPYRAGRELVLDLLARAPAHLRPGGRLVVVGKGSQGIVFYQHWLEDRWGEVTVLGRQSGYRVIAARDPPSEPHDARQVVNPKIE